VIKIIDEPETSIMDLMKIVKGPDFPTGGEILGKKGIKDAYLTGRGSIKMRAKADIEEVKGGREIIRIDELPYQVNKANLIQTIANLVKDKKINGISDIRDESDRKGMRVIIEIRKGDNAQLVYLELTEKDKVIISKAKSEIERKKKDKKKQDVPLTPDAKKEEPQPKDEMPEKKKKPVSPVKEKAKSSDKIVGGIKKMFQKKKKKKKRKKKKRKKNHFQMKF